MAGDMPGSRKRNVTMTSTSLYNGLYSADTATSPNKRYKSYDAALMAPAPRSQSRVIHGAATEPSPLLKLPRELRDKIYSKVGGDHFEGHLDREHPGKLGSSSSALLRANKQIHDEYLDALYHKADIIARVVDFDFAHVITFINNLAERARNTLPHINPSSTRNIVVLLVLKKNQIERGLDHAAEYRLEWWFTHLQTPTRTGAGTNVSYKIRLSEYFQQQRESGIRSDFFSWWVPLFISDLRRKELQRVGGWTEQKKKDLRELVKAVELA